MTMFTLEVISGLKALLLWRMGKNSKSKSAHKYSQINSQIFLRKLLPTCLCHSFLKFFSNSTALTWVFLLTSRHTCFSYGFILPGAVTVTWDTALEGIAQLHLCMSLKLAILPLGLIGPYIKWSSSVMYGTCLEAEAVCTTIPNLAIVTPDLVSHVILGPDYLT